MSCKHITYILQKIVSSFNLNIIYVYHNFTILPLHHITISTFHHFTITPFHNITVLPINNFNNAQFFSNYAGNCQKCNVIRISNVLFLRVSLQFLDNVIEILHISMIFSTNNSDIYLINIWTETFLVCIPVLQCKFAGIIDRIFCLGDPGSLFHTFNRRTLTVK